MIKNKLFNTKPCMVHAPGKFEFLPLWNQLISLSNYPFFKTKLPESITLITFNNGSVYGHNKKLLSVLENSLDFFNIKYTVLGKGIIEWKNSMKIQLLHDFLKKVKTKYIIYCDSSDVFVVNKLDNICHMFEKMNCDALFNSEKKSWPKELPKKILDFDKSINNQYYLNSGLWIAKTDFALKLLERCQSFSEGIKSTSDQFYYRLCYPEFYPKMKVDYRCEIFQGINRVGLEEIEFIKPF